jgi:iron complex outermembrane receptor protein
MSSFIPRLRACVHRQRLKLLLLQTATAFGAVLASGPAWSAEVDPFLLSPEQLFDATIVSASRMPERFGDTPAAAYIITQEDIIRSGVTNIPDALRIVPGVNVAQLASHIWAISIRGFNSFFANKLLVMIDGRTIYNPVFGGVFWEAHDLVLEDIERIEVIRGPGGTLWGANAVNGVINIITKHSADTQGTLVSGIYGNEERGALSARHGGTFGDDGSYRVYAKIVNRDASRHPSGVDAFDAWSTYRGGFRADLGDRFTLQGEAYHTASDYIRADFPMAPPYFVISQQNIQYDGANLLGRWTDSGDDGSQFTIQAYLDWARRDEPFNFIDDRLTFDLEAQYNVVLGRHELVVGGGYRFARAREDNEGLRDIVFTPDERQDSIFNAFLQDKITLVPERWFLTVGSKVEHNPFSGFEIQPNGRLLWQPDESQAVWAAISRAVRTPTPLEQDVMSVLGSGPGVVAAVVGNPDFDSEELTAYEIGYRKQLTPMLSADLTAFYNDYDRLSTLSFLDPRVVDNGIDPPHFLIPVEFQNEMTGEALGAEASFTWNVSQNLKLIANYSYLHVSLLADNTDLPQEGAEDTHPYHQANIRASWNISENWTLDTTGYFVDRLRSADDVGSYFRVDVNLGWRLNERLRLNLIGQNLTDETHREMGPVNSLVASEVERSIFGRLTWEF